MCSVFSVWSIKNVFFWKVNSHFLLILLNFHDLLFFLLNFLLNICYSFQLSVFLIFYITISLLLSSLHFKVSSFFLFEPLDLQIKLTQSLFFSRRNNHVTSSSKFVFHCLAGDVLGIVSSKEFYFFGTGVWTGGLTLGRHSTTWATPLAFFALVILQVGSRGVGLRPWSSYKWPP
jgi:hypothetical protein